MKYKRVLLKLSGESLMGQKQFGIDSDRLNIYCKEIKDAVKNNVQVAIVIGGGNIFRGLQGVSDGIGRANGDYMGMLATVINSLALESALEEQSVKTKLLSGLTIDSVTESMSGSKAIEYLESGYVVIISGGTGNPYFTTDTASVLRALEIKSDVVLKGTRVDGVYDSDPEINSNAKKYDTLSFDDAYNNGLKIMDLTAFTLCSENNMPIVVFNINDVGNLKKVLEGQSIGTLVTN
ncbi:MAG: UMP kinase [Bacteroidetes bacterium]|nr:UMP kinase [Bacteroidota bacterium]